ncbi:MAG: hypothetical protein K2G36_02690 [Ruminococcus sp.]|nr:hypothetical protein [Ruminococcus sp.]
MFREENYRFCVNSALQIMQEQRKKLFNDCIHSDPTIYNGLHSSESPALCRLYFQAYFVEWVGMHWETMFEILKRHSEYSAEQRRKMILFFAEYLSELISECSQKGLLANLAVPELLKVQKKQLKEMIQFSGKWEHNSNKLRVQMKKGHEQYMKLIREAEAEAESE